MCNASDNSILLKKNVDHIYQIDFTTLLWIVICNMKNLTLKECYPNMSPL